MSLAFRRLHGRHDKHRFNRDGFPAMLFRDDMIDLMSGRGISLMNAAVLAAIARSDHDFAALGRVTAGVHYEFAL